MLNFIGIGSAFNTVQGNNSAYYKVDNKLFLIDCGSANFHLMKASGFLNNIEEIHVYVTHTHADHVGSLADLIFYMFYCKGAFIPRVTVYAQKDIEVDEYLAFNGVTEDVHYNYAPMKYDEVVDIEALGLGFVSYRTSHVEELKSYGLIIDFYEDNKFALYTGDTNYLTEKINGMFEDNLDYLYVDTCSQDYEGNVHLSLFKLHQTVKKEHRDKVWCMHLDEKFDKELAKSLGFNVAEVKL